MRLPPTFAAFRHRNYRLWFVGQTISITGTWMQSVAQSWLIYDLTGSKLALGTVSFLGSLPTLFLMLPGGAVADRIPRRKLLLLTQSAMMVLAFILAALAATGVLRVWHIALLAACLGVAQSFDAPARQALVVEMVEDRKDLLNAIALNSTIFNLGRIIGPAIGGMVLAAVGAAWCFALNGASFVAVIVALWCMRLRPSQQGRQRSQGLLADAREGLRYVARNRIILAMIGLTGFANLFGMSYATLMPVYAADVLRVGERGLGILNAAVGVGALVGSLTLASLTRYRRKGLLLAVGSILFPLSALLYGFSRSFPLSLFCLALVGWAIVTQNSSNNTLIQTLCPDELRGRVMSVFTLMIFGTSPFASLQAGMIAQFLGPTAGVAVGAGLVLLFACYTHWRTPALRELEA